MSSLPRATSPSDPFPAAALEHPRAVGAAPIHPASPSVHSTSPSSPLRTASSASSSNHADTDPLAYVSGRDQDLPDLEPGELPRQRPHTRPAETLTDKLLLALSSGTFTLGQIAAQNNITLTQLIRITSDPEFQDQLEALRRLTHQQTTLTATTYMPRGVQILAQLIHGAELDIDEMRQRARDLIYDKPELFCRWSDTIRKVVHLLARLTKPPTPARDRAPRADRAIEVGAWEGGGDFDAASPVSSTSSRSRESHLTTGGVTGVDVSPIRADFAAFTSLFNTPTRAHSSSHNTPFDIPQVVRESSIPLHASRDDRFSEIDATLAALESALNTAASTPSRSSDASDLPAPRAIDVVGLHDIDAPANSTSPITLQPLATFAPLSSPSSCSPSASPSASPPRSSWTASSSHPP